MMKKIILIREDQHKKLRAEAYRKNLSQSEIVRRAIDEYLKDKNNGGKAQTDG